MTNSWIRNNGLALVGNNLGPSDFSSVTQSTNGVDFAARLKAAANHDADACFDLGIAFSTEADGLACDLVEAHKWFNLAALAGHEDAPAYRTEAADDMTAREIAEAQRRARAWLAALRASDLRRAA